MLEKKVWCGRLHGMILLIYIYIYIYIGIKVIYTRRSGLYLLNDYRKDLKAEKVGTVEKFIVAPGHSRY